MYSFGIKRTNFGMNSNLQESKREERKKLADEDALRKIKQLEEQKYELQKQVANQKPVDGSWPGHYGARPFVGSQVMFRFLNLVKNDPKFDPKIYFLFPSTKSSRKKKRF